MGTCWLYTSAPRLALSDFGKSLPPGGMTRTPSEVVLGLGVRTRALLGIMTRCSRPRSAPAMTAHETEASRRRGGDGRKPVVYRSRFIVHDIVDAGLAPFDRRGSRLGRVVDMQERLPSIAAADHRNAVPTNLFDRLGFEHAGVRAIETAIAQHNAFGGGDGVLQISDRIERGANRGGLGSSGSSSDFT